MFGNLFKKPNSTILLEQYKKLFEKEGFFKITGVKLNTYNYELYLDDFTDDYNPELNDNAIEISFLFGEYKGSISFDGNPLPKSFNIGDNIKIVNKFLEYGICAFNKQDCLVDTINDIGKGQEKILKSFLKKLTRNNGILLSTEGINISKNILSEIEDNISMERTEHFLLFTGKDNTFKIKTNSGIKVLDYYIMNNFIKLCGNNTNIIINNFFCEVKMAESEENEKIDKELKRLLSIKPLDNDLQKRFDILKKLEDIYQNVNKEHEEILKLRKEYQNI